MFKKIAVLAAALLISAPALADRGDRRGHGYGHGYGYGYYKHRPVVRHVYHRPAPRRVVVHHYYRPAPRPVVVVERHHAVNPVAVLAGAVIGAAVVHHAVNRY